MLNRWVDDAISYIRAVQPKVHRLILNGNYRYPEITEALGHMHLEDGSRRQNWRRDAYRGMAYLQLPEGSLTVFYSPYGSKPRPRCMIETSSPSKSLFLKLATALPLLKVTSFELAFDLHCKGYDREDQLMNTKMLFDVISRFLFIPWTVSRERVRFCEPDPEMNVTYYVGDWTLYLRGRDENRTGNGWLMRDVEFVRLERTVTTSKLFLQQFVDNGLDVEKVLKSLSFKKPKDGVRCMPSETGPYLTEDEKGNCGSIQLEYFAVKDRVKNPRKLVMEKTNFRELKEILSEAGTLLTQVWKGKELGTELKVVRLWNIL